MEDAAKSQVLELEMADEKTAYVQSAQLEHSLAAGLSFEEATYVQEFSKKAHNKAFRKVDWRLMPVLMSLYLIANLDRYVIIFITICALCII